METGWVCPKCGRVYAPSVKECYHCNNIKNDELFTPNRPDMPVIPEKFPSYPNMPGWYKFPAYPYDIHKVYCSTGNKPLNS